MNRAAIKIRLFRQQHQLSQGELGARYGLTRQRVCRYENGERVPRDKAVMQAMANDGVADHADWFTAFEAHQGCALCSVRSDDPSVWQCDKADCPNAHRKVAAPKAEEVTI